MAGQASNTMLFDQGDSVRHLLAGLSTRARRAVEVAAFLGSTCSFDHVAGMLDTPPASLLGPLEELADLLVDDGNRLSFRDEDIRQAVIETVPGSARPALHRQAIDVLIHAGASPVEPAAQLAASAQIGDRAAISALADAARTLGPADPQGAADLSRRAFDLTPIGDGLRAQLAAETALWLHAADLARDGRDFADAALRERFAPAQEAEVQLSIARMSALSPEVRVEAGRGALGLRGLPASLRADHLSQLLDNVLESGRPEAAREMLPDTVTAVMAAGDATATYAMQVAQSRLAYMEGAFHDALALMESSVPFTAADAVSRVQTASPEEWRAEVLLAVDEFDSAWQTAAHGLAVARRGQQSWAERSWLRFQGRHLLQVGRIPDAAAILDGTLDLDDDTPVSSVRDAAALLTLGRIAIHTGDGRAARLLASCAENVLECATPEVRRHAAWFLALHALAGSNPEHARARLEELGRDAERSALPLLMIDVADYPHLVRLALGAGDDDLAARAVEAAEALRAGNPDVGSFAAIAAHARGLLDRDLAALANATELFDGGSRALAQASALEDYGIELVRAGNRDCGIETLGDALRMYSSAGARWDAARVRRRLRELGVRRRLMKSTRPTTGWAGLTDAEIAVVRLVAEGLTNREVAERLFVSPHTVSMHLRHTFTKCNINSRVELTRLVIANEEAA